VCGLLVHHYRYSTKGRKVGGMDTLAGHPRLFSWERIVRADLASYVAG
jgi:hypothetical protein